MSEVNTASFPLYSPHGVRVTFTIEAGAGVHINQAISALLADGYTVNVAGAEAGETVEDVGYVSRRVKNDGTSAIDVFSPNALLTRKIFTHYLDTPEMIADFQQATGLEVDRIPVFEGDAAIQKTSNTWSKYGVAVRKPAKIALKDNPRHDPNETEVAKKKPKHLFARWMPTTPPLAEVPRPTPASSSSGTDGDAANVKSASAVARIEVGANPTEAFDKAFPATVPPQSAEVGSLNMIKLLNAAIKEKTVDNIHHFNHLIPLLLRTEAITHTSSFDEVLTAIRQHKEQKLA
jgi:hypothetical protein